MVTHPQLHGPTLLRGVSLLALCTGCYHWGHVESLDEIEGAARVRVEPEQGAAYVLERPTRTEVREAAVEQHARISLWKLDGAGTAGLITGVVLATAAPMVAAVLFSLLTPHYMPAEDRQRPP